MVKSSSLDSKFATLIHYSARDLIQHAGPHLEARARESNIIYPHALDLKSKEENGEAVLPNQLWITCWTRNPRGHSLDFVLSCTSHLLGDYPIFIYCNHLASSLTDAFVRPRVQALALALSGQVPPTRVFSIFSLKSVTDAFVDEWTALTGVAPILDDPYYLATSSFCSRESFKGARQPLELGHVMRRATMDDLEECATLCREFADTSPPFILTQERARTEAYKMIKLNQLWIYRVPTSPSTSAVTCIVAATRSSSTVAAITKVFTSPSWRRRGYAEQLAAHVLGHLLYMAEKEYVVLYVGHTLAAKRVYDRLGFVGLSSDPNAKGVDAVDDWLEIGFANTTLGHW
jgi:ribosomal protein S18 acetylase RimI-like enzyme